MKRPVSHIYTSTRVLAMPTSTLTYQLITLMLYSASTKHTKHIQLKQPNDLRPNYSTNIYIIRNTVKSSQPVKTTMLQATNSTLWCSSYNHCPLMSNIYKANDMMFVLLSGYTNYITVHKRFGVCTMCWVATNTLQSCPNNVSCTHVVRETCNDNNNT